MMAQGALADFNEADFDARVLRRQGLTVIDFWSESCVPCKHLSRLLGEIATEVPDSVLIGKVNSDENPALVERFGIRAVPTVLFFRDGDVVETRTGVDRRQVLKKLIEAYVRD